jgi:hypothetical protein
MRLAELLNDFLKGLRAAEVFGQLSAGDRDTADWIDIYYQQPGSNVQRVLSLRPTIVYGRCVIRIVDHSTVAASPRAPADADHGTT